MSENRLLCEAERFLSGHRSLPVDRRLVFEVRADRQHVSQTLKPRLGSLVKAVPRRGG